jgi:DNA (cytosine-5)-methyltransferase 1
MMGLPEGWVTNVPGLSRKAQLKALGNGVVPQQGELAVRLLLGRVPRAAAHRLQLRLLAGDSGRPVCA